MELKYALNVQMVKEMNTFKNREIMKRFRENFKWQESLPTTELKEITSGFLYYQRFT